MPLVNIMQDTHRASHHLLTLLGLGKQEGSPDASILVWPVIPLQGVQLGCHHCSRREQVAGSPDL